jgi:prepilin-type N-terminal cleavage/methylation domain-containing protein
VNMVESRELRVECQNPGVALRASFGPQHSTLYTQLSRRGVTLIELLIVILIISILAALVLGVAAVAGETARQAQSRHIVERLHTLMREHYDSYKTRRVKLRESDSTAKGIEAQISDKFPNDPSRRGQALAEARLYAMRELMLMEVPDRWSDIVLRDVGAPGVGDDDPGSPLDAGLAKAPFYLNGRTDLANVYLRRYAGLVNRMNSITGAVNTAGDIKRNQGAECLYMFITLACADGEARSLFKEADIGDSDGDGAPEFLDGWGHPISFLRWAPGFDSQIQLNANNLQSTDNTLPTYWRTAAAKDHDPFDVFRRDLFAYRLVPLIYSPGRDESSGLVSDTGFVTWRSTAFSSSTMTFNNTNVAPYITGPVLDPYAKVAIPPAYKGTSLHLADPTNYPDETSTDDVHNHLMGQR